MKVLNNYEASNLNVVKVLEDIKNNPYHLMDGDVAQQCRALLEEIYNYDYSEFDDEVTELFDNYLFNSGYKSLRDFFNLNIDIEMVDIVLVDRKNKIVDVFQHNNYSGVLLDYIDRDSNFDLREDISIKLELTEDQGLYEELDKLNANELDDLCYSHYSNRELYFKALVFEDVLCDFSYNEDGDIDYIDEEDIIAYYCK